MPAPTPKRPSDLSEEIATLTKRLKTVEEKVTGKVSIQTVEDLFWQKSIDIDILRDDYEKDRNLLKERCDALEQSCEKLETDLDNSHETCDGLVTTCAKLAKDMEALKNNSTVAVKVASEISTPATTTEEEIEVSEERRVELEKAREYLTVIPARERSRLVEHLQRVQQDDWVELGIAAITNQVVAGTQDDMIRTRRWFMIQDYVFNYWELLSELNYITKVGRHEYWRDDGKDFILTDQDMEGWGDACVVPLLE